MNSAVLLLGMVCGSASAVDVIFERGPGPVTPFDGAASVRMIDVDLDGDLDLLGAAVVADSISWWENTDGTGGAWVEHEVTSTLFGVSEVAAADLDGDGDLDVVASGEPFDELGWWENTSGDGRSWTEHTISVGEGEASVSTGDIDGDGDIDLVASSALDAGVVWWENTSGDAGLWTRHDVAVPLYGVRSVRAADIDGDGDLDMLATASIDDVLRWWENTDGIGLTWTEHTIHAPLDGAWSAQAVDLDGDGDLDVAAAAHYADDLSWWENAAGDGTTWTRHTVRTGLDGASSVFAADMDGDLDLDLVASARTDNLYAWWENTDGLGIAWSEHVIACNFDDGASSVAVGDLDGDGDADVAGAAVDDDAVVWFDNLFGDGSVMRENLVDTRFVGAVTAVPADLDADGDMDVLAGSYNSHSIAWWDNADGEGQSWSAIGVGGGLDYVLGVDAVDIDGDGDLDVVGAASIGGLTWWQNDTGDARSWVQWPIVTLTGPASVDTSDLDGDGDPDLLVAGSQAGFLSWWENDAGDGSSWTERSIATGLLTTMEARAADVDGDGDLDVIAPLFSYSEVRWWENTAGDASTWTEHIVGSGFGGARAVFAADIDSDGDLDIAGAAESDDDVVWWENTSGTGLSWTEHTVTTNFDGANHVVAADVDGDGDLDLVGTAHWANSLLWWDNTAGDGTAWVERSLTTDFDDAAEVEVVDLDGDGLLDVLGVASGNDTIAWWRSLGPDSDGDGDPDSSDCAPNDPLIATGSAEVCNGVDDDCDGLQDEGFDADGDGFTTCGADGVYFTPDDDCNDTDLLVYPGFFELCNGIDDNCDGQIDEGYDLDGDGVPGCQGDCDDGDPSVWPGAPELCDLIDNDCDVAIDEGHDSDGDGFTWCDGDCDDVDPMRYSGAPELCDGLDNDCNGVADAPDEVDADLDGVLLCAGDCDDSDAANHPGNAESCDGQDNDCNGAADFAGEVDGDADGQLDCAGDCDDADPTAYVGAPEICDGVDNDCNGALPADEQDADGDGHAVCTGDCDDADATTYPGATELCDDRDSDCNGDLVDGFADLDTDDWPDCADVDADGDGHEGALGNNADCDDADDQIHPGQVEICDDGVDQDCDGADLPCPGTTDSGDPGTTTGSGTGSGTGTGGATGTGTGVTASGTPVGDGGSGAGVAEDKGGCGCATGGSGSAGWLALATLLWARRRVSEARQ